MGRQAVAMMRQVGPAAWTVLSALAVDAEPGPGERMARVSVRSLALELGLDKDTVARASGRLRDAGLVSHERVRFDRSVYRLNVPENVFEFRTDAPSCLVARPARSSITSSGSPASGPVSAGRARPWPLRPPPTTTSAPSTTPSDGWRAL
jgi:hypothetical protein